MAGRAGRTNAAAPGQLRVALAVPALFGIALVHFVWFVGLKAVPAALSKPIKDSERQILFKQVKDALDANARAQIKEKDSIEALALKLPVLLPYPRAQSGRDLNNDRVLKNALLKLIGPNPYEREDALKGELNRVRAAIEAHGYGERKEGLYFMPCDALDNASLARLLESERELHFDPGTVIIFISAQGGFAITAIGLDGKEIKFDGQPFYKSGRLHLKL